MCRCVSVGVLVLSLVAGNAAAQLQVLSDDPVRIGLTLGGDLMNKERNEEARVQFGKVIQMEPGDHEAYYRRAVCAIYLNRYRDALPDLNQAIALLAEHVNSRTVPPRHAPDPALHRATLSKYHRVRAEVHDALKDPRASFADLNKAIDIFPHNVEALNNRAAKLLERSRHSEALRDLDAALRINPRQRLSYKVRAQVLERLGRDVEALRDALLFRELDDRFNERQRAYQAGVAAHERALANQSPKDFDAALHGLTIALSIDRDLASGEEITLAESAYELGATHVDMLDIGRGIGYLDECRRRYEEAWRFRESNTGMAQAYEVLAEGAFQLRDFDRARYFAGQAMAINRLNWGTDSLHYATSAHNYAMLRARSGEHFRPAQAADLKCALSRAAEAAAYAQKHLDRHDVRARARAFIVSYCCLLKRCGRTKEADAVVAALAITNTELSKQVAKDVAEHTEFAPLYIVPENAKEPSETNIVGHAAFHVQDAEQAAADGNWETALAEWTQARAFQRAAMEAISTSVSEDGLSKYLGGDSDDWLAHALSIVRVRPEDERFRRATAEWLLGGKSVKGEWLAGRYQTINRISELNPNRLHAVQGPLQELRKLRHQLTSVENPEPKLFEREAELDALIARRMADTAVRGDLMTRVTLDDIRRALPKDGILIEVFRVPDRLEPVAHASGKQHQRDVVWVIRALDHEPAVTVVDLGNEHDNDVAIAAQQQLHWKPDLRQAQFAKLWNEARLDEAEQWWISPHHSWWSLAWEAFRNPNTNEYIVHSKVIRYVTTGRRLLAGAEDTGVVSAPALAAPADSVRLPIDRAVMAEALAKVTGLAPRQLDVDHARFADDFLALNRPAMLVVFTHGGSPNTTLRSSSAVLVADDCSFDPPPFVSPNRWRDCALRDSRDRVTTVSALDILAVDLRATGLVLLLACRSAAGPTPQTQNDGEAIVTLREAFHIAGATAVVGALGDVPVASTAEMGRLLLEELAKSHELGEPLDAGLALTKTKRTYLKQHGANASPDNWAGLTVSVRGVGTRGSDAARVGAAPPAKPLDVMLEEARELEANGKSPYNALTAAIEAYPNDYRPHYLRAKFSLARQVLRGEMILDDLDRAVKLAPKDAEILALRAQVHFDNRFYHAAELDSEAAIKLGAKQSDLSKIRWLAQWYEGKYEQALQSGIDYVKLTQK